ncbi:hypothetical protein D9619_003343 [Psilocybe cf. subviscida]|uniref:Uncharacterized protein n=1 Tax=Psilocybe cf. subviscida TaxID=2480587 RepID=A0A8H5ETM1_9AGAR|nr:hypothetical protein D9619_003343 [Psilocybe cf. subviscida]
MPSVVSAASEFVASIFNIFLSLGQSLFAVFHAVFALVEDGITGAFKLVTHVLSMFTELFSGAVGFIAGNFVAILVVVGGFFAYQQYLARNRSTIHGSTNKSLKA